MRVLLAPDKFKDALDAPAVCAAMEAGVRDAWPQAEVRACPLADGGEGTGRLLAAVLQAQPQYAVALDPLGRERIAQWWLTPDHRTAVVEMAAASGLCLLAPHERRAPHASSFGTGQLLRAAWDRQVQRILLCVGGSATVDGGAGCLQALGWELRDAGGRALPAPVTAQMLPRVADLRRPPGAAFPELEILCDVDNPLLGPRGAIPVYAPQKGADPAELVQLELGLRHWAGVLERLGAKGIGDLPHGGAAGGLPAGLHAALGARLVSGFERVADLTELARQLSECDLCLTGEGRLDEQTVAGKVVAGVARHARAAGVPAVAFVGAARVPGNGSLRELADAVGLTEIVAISPPGLPTEQAIARTAEFLRGAVRDLLSRWPGGPSAGRSGHGYN